MTNGERPVGTAREPERQQREKTARTTASNPRKYLILLTLRLGKGRIPFPSHYCPIIS